MPILRLPSNQQLGSLSQKLTGTDLKSSTPKAANYSLPSGLSGNIATIDFMRREARKAAKNPIVREFALKILQSYGVPSHSYAEEALAIGDFVLRRVRYVRDPRESELLQDPVMLIEKLERQGFAQGDCDDMALLIATLLLSIGHDPLFRAVRYQDTSGPYNHIYVVVYERNYPGPEQRLVLDAILKDKPIGSETRHASGDEFRVV